MHAGHSPRRRHARCPPARAAQRRVLSYQTRPVPPVPREALRAPGTPAVEASSRLNSSWV